MSLSVRNKRSGKNQVRMTEVILKRSWIEPILGIFLSEGTPSTIYCQNTVFFAIFFF